TSGTYIGLQASMYQRPAGGTVLRQVDSTWTQTANGNPYIQSSVTTLNSVQSKSEQTVNDHGNVTVSKVYDYGNLVTPIRTFTNTYLSDSNYTSRHIWNRLLSTDLSDNASHTVTLFTNTYDNYGQQLVDHTGVSRQHDDANYGLNFIYRGNKVT